MRADELTLEEKLALLVAAGKFHTDDLGGKVRRLNVADGPSGLRKETPEHPEGSPSRCYPSAHVIANSWNPSVAESVGRAIASDCRDEGVDMILGPGVNIKRNPLCGRNFEYFSEDPLLAGSMAEKYVDGVQKTGVGATVKHFMANNREWERCAQSSEIDERTIMEIYARPFAIAMRAHPKAVMCSYNPVNGVYASENPYLLKDILRKKLGFGGVVVSDWGAVHNRARALKAGLDIEFPDNPASAGVLRQAIERGEITEKYVDDSVNRILGLLEDTCESAAVLTVEKREQISLSAAKEGMVLLKNNGVLPLEDGAKIAVIGEMAKNPTVCGGGSAHVHSSLQSRPLDEILKGLLPSSEITYSQAYLGCVPMSLGHGDARRAAFASDVAVVVVGNNMYNETESLDRESLALPSGQEKVIDSVIRENPNTVVVVEAGSSVDVSAWADKAAAIVYTGYAGDMLNEALASVLAGETVPSGKLSETFPLSLEDTFTGHERGNGFSDRYREGVLVGYRYYDAYGLPVRYPFGYGLSYTKFEYSDLTLNCDKDNVAVSFSITNTGERDGAEIAEVYVEHFHSPVERPPKELAGFGKVFIRKGKTVRMTVNLGRKAFAFYSTVYGRFAVSGGTYGIAVGASSRDIRLQGRVELEGDINTF